MSVLVECIVKVDCWSLWVLTEMVINIMSHSKSGLCLTFPNSTVVHPASCQVRSNVGTYIGYVIKVGFALIFDSITAAV